MNLNDYLLSLLQSDEASGRTRLCRTLPDGVVDFGSNDYLGFSDHSEVIGAATEVLQQAGMGPRSARLLSGHRPEHAALEEALAQLKGTEAALTFSSGYAMSTGLFAALCSGETTVILDASAHACLWDGARLSGSRVRVVRHNDMEHLAEVLQHERELSSSRPIWVVVESLYSMDGDLAPLGELVELKDRWGAWLVVDEAHATGVYGPGGQGLVASDGWAERVEVQLGTLGKALGVMGGFVAGPGSLIAVLRQRCRSFLFTTAPPPLLAAAALASLRLLTQADGVSRRKHLSRLIGHAANHPLAPAAVHGPIIPFIIGETEVALRVAEALIGAGFYVPAIRAPTVPEGSARLRLSITARHSTNEIDRVFSLIRQNLSSD